MGRPLLLVLRAALLAGCVTAPLPERGPASEALPIGDDTFLDRAVQAELAGQP